MSIFSEISYFLGGFGLLSLFSPILTPLFFVLRLFGVHYFTIRNDEEKVRAIIKYLQKNTTSSEIMYQHGNSFPSGTFISPTCIGFYKYSGLRDAGTGEVQMLTTKSMFTKMVESEKISSAFLSKKLIESVDSTEFIEEETRLLYSRYFRSREKHNWSSCSQAVERNILPHVQSHWSRRYLTSTSPRLRPLWRITNSYCFGRNQHYYP